jgi:hypothetical protein
MNDRASETPVDILYAWALREREKQKEVYVDSKTLDGPNAKVDKLAWLIDWAERQLGKKKE